MEYLPNPLLLPVGIAIGILVAAPIGPVNVLCIQRAVERGMWSGFAAALGAVLADGLIALAAALSVGAITGTFARYRLLIETIGGLVLIAAGLKLLVSRPPEVSAPLDCNRWPGLRDILWDIPKSFLMTVTNPAAVLGLIAIFGGVSMFVEVRSTIDALTLVAAIVTGSTLWWLFLSAIVARLRERINLQHIARINVVAGFLLVVFGLVLLSKAGLMLDTP